MVFLRKQHISYGERHQPLIMVLSNLFFSDSSGKNYALGSSVLYTYCLGYSVAFLRAAVIAFSLMGFPHGVWTKMDIVYSIHGDVALSPSGRSS